LPESEVSALKRQNYGLALKLHDVTDIADVDRQAPHNTRIFPCDTVAVGDLHLPIAVDNRDYLVELGYVDKEEVWHALARSTHVRVPACPSTIPQSLGVGAAAAGAAAGSVASAALIRDSSMEEAGRVILTPRDCRSAYAYWELPQSQINDLRTGNRTLKVRLYDVTELPGSGGRSPNSLQEFDAALTSPGDLHLPIAVDDRDYLVEVGYVDGVGQWHTLAKANSVRVPACVSAAATTPAGLAAAGVVTPSLTTPSLGSPGTGVTGTVSRAATDVVAGAGHLTSTAVAGGVAAVAGLGAASRSVFNRSADAVSNVTSGIGTRSDLGAESKIILVPRSAAAAYAYWEVAEVHRQALKDQGGRTLALRIHDATNLELDHQTPHSTQEYILSDAEPDKHVAIAVPDRDYVAELGYLTDSGEWLQLVRSLHVRVPNP
jgi:phosphate transport system substrate-binding protein